MSFSPDKAVAETEPAVTIEADRMIPAIIVPNLFFFAKVYDKALETHVPNAINIFSHAGNIGISECVGLVTGYVAGRLSEYLAENTDESFQKRTKRIVVGTAFAAGLAVNAITETKWGQRILPDPNTFDTFDIAYGTAAATLGAAFGVNVEAQDRTAAETS